MCMHACVSLCVFCTDLTKLHVADSTDHWTCQWCAGDQFAVGVLRTQSTLGTVRVSWTIEGLNGLQPQLGFQTFTGTLTFLPVRTCKHQHTYICCQYRSPLCDSNCIEKSSACSFSCSCWLVWICFSTSLSSYSFSYFFLLLLLHFSSSSSSSSSFF